MFRDDGGERCVHVRRHPVRVATNIERGAALEPLVQLAARLGNALLHVGSPPPVAREGEVDACEGAALQRALPLELVKEVAREMTGAKNEPVASAGAGRDALLYEGAVGSDSGARADHDDVAGAVRRQAEARVRLDADGH